MSSRPIDLMTSRSEKTCAVATASVDGAPCAALAFYVVLEDDTLLLATHTDSRKWANLLATGRIGLVAGWTFAEPHVQLDGRAELVPAVHPRFAALAKAYYGALPQTAAFRSATTAFVLVRPDWARVTWFRPDAPPVVEEGPM